MPKQFLECIKRGGKVRTKKLPNGKYIHICFLNKKSFPGEIKKKKQK